MRKRESDEPRLFDLPLVPAGEERPAEPAPADEAEDRFEDEARPEERARGGPPDGAAVREWHGDEGLPLFADEPPVAHRADRAAAPPPRPRPVPSPRQPSPRAPEREPEPAFDDPAFASPVEAAPIPVPRGPVPAPFSARLLAALADLGVHLAVAGAGWLGTILLGARLGAADLPAVALFLLAFSFLYAVVSLAFWGRTPGMAAAGVVARGAGDQPLTFGQTGLRWLAGVLTAALAGLPLLVALTGRSLGDRLSGSTTLHYR